MYSFSARSKANLAEADVRLQRIYNFVIKFWDCQIIDGVRTMAEQIKNVEKGVSKTLASKHLPDKKTGKSRAIDAMPYPYDYNKIERGLNAIKAVDGGMEVLEVYMFQGFVAGVAACQGTPVRQGVDWNSNRQFEDQTFHDLPHTEIDE